MQKDYPQKLEWKIIFKVSLFLPFQVIANISGHVDFSVNLEMRTPTWRILVLRMERYHSHRQWSIPHGFIKYFPTLIQRTVEAGSEAFINAEKPHLFKPHSLNDLQEFENEPATSISAK